MLGLGLYDESVNRAYIKAEDWTAWILISFVVVPNSSFNCSFLCLLHDQLENETLHAQVAGVPM